LRNEYVVTINKLVIKTV